MRLRGRVLGSVRGGRRSKFAVLVGAVLVALLAGAAPAPAGGRGVVPVNGKVAGEGYAYYLQRFWQLTFAGNPNVKLCPTVTVNGQEVGMLMGGPSGPGLHTLSCNEPAGRPLYVPEANNECSTNAGDHGKFGTSDSELEKCSVALFKGARAIASVDGRPVDVTKLASATAVYSIHLPKHNAFKSKQLTGRSAAYGFGLLLTGLPSGNHTIYSVAIFGTTKLGGTFKVHVS